MRNTKRLTKDEFIRRAFEVHNGKYDYSGVIYVNSKTPSEISCPLHGSFNQRPYNHMKGEGCPKCGYESTREKRLNSVEEFIIAAHKKHNNFYDYSKVVYQGSKSKVNIKCPLHGEFFQTPNNHLRGQTCPECAQILIAEKNRKTIKEFVEDAKKVHGERYDYSNVVYTHKDENVEISCQTHGVFRQSPHNHLHGAGCPKCCLSKGEEKIMLLLDGCGIEYIPQKTFIGCRSPKGRMLKFDFFVPKKNLLIEYDGPQHYGHLRIGKYMLKKTEYERLKIHDRTKNEYADVNGIVLLRIPYWEDNLKECLKKYL